MDECGIQAQPRHLRMAYCPCQYAEEVLLNKQPNQNIIDHEIFVEYKKKIKTKNEKDFWERRICGGKDD